MPQFPRPDPCPTVTGSEFVAENARVGAVMQKPTEGPWTRSTDLGVYSDAAKRSNKSGRHVSQRVLLVEHKGLSDEEIEANARLIVAACNEFQRHFADPVAAAEGDMLGKMVEALREAREALHHHYVEWDGEPEDAGPIQLARSKIDTLLAQVRK